MKKIIYPIAAALLCCTGAQAQTQTIAHRGFWTTSGSAQNSIASLVKADSVECYGSEFDLWVTADNRIVVHHDANEGDCVIERSTYSELMKHTIANGEKVPTLEQYLEKGKKLKTKLICEIKPHSDVARTLTCVDMTLKAFKKYKLTKRVTYITFSLPAFVKLLSEAPQGTEVYYLSGDLSPKQLKEMGAAGMDYSWGTICQHWDWIAEAHALGLKVNIWTIDNVDEMRKLVDAGVDYITTNQPTLCNDIVKEKK
jgi:glycerophosphoryl diester phosphodiesterase